MNTRVKPQSPSQYSMAITKEATPTRERKANAEMEGGGLFFSSKRRRAVQAALVVAGAAAVVTALCAYGVAPNWLDTTATAWGGANNEDGSDEKSAAVSRPNIDVHPLLLLPLPMALLRQNASLTDYYPKFPNRSFLGNCSCLNPTSNTRECCSRTIRRSHKMGSVMTTHLFESYQPEIRKIWDPESHNYTQDIPSTDYRDAILLRNLFDSLVSGYLYHSRYVLYRMHPSRCYFF